MGLGHYYLKFIITQRFKDQVQQPKTTGVKISTQEPKTQRNKGSKYNKTELRHFSRTEGKMEKEHEAYVNPSFDPDADQTGKKDLDNGAAYSNGVAVSMHTYSLYSGTSFTMFHCLPNG